MERGALLGSGEFLIHHPDAFGNLAQQAAEDGYGGDGVGGLEGIQLPAGQCPDEAAAAEDGGGTGGGGVEKVDFPDGIALAESGEQDIAVRGGGDDVKGAGENDVEGFLAIALLDEDMAIFRAEEASVAGEEGAVLGGYFFEEAFGGEFRCQWGWIAHEVKGWKGRGVWGWEGMESIPDEGIAKAWLSELFPIPRGFEGWGGFRIMVCEDGVEIAVQHRRRDAVECLRKKFHPAAET